MAGSPVPAHWIKANESTRLPRRHVCLDVEAIQTDIPGGKSQSFRLAVASFDHQRKAGERWQPAQWGQFTDARTLWEWVDTCTQAGRRTIVVAHNLAYDLRVGQAFVHLPALGYRVEMIRLDGGSAWCSWRRDDRTLTMVDTVSWFGTSLERVGELMGRTKPALPAWNDTQETWFARCQADVEILRAAWRRVLDWIEDADLGNWKPTGAGQGWTAFRHKHLTHRILHHGNERIAGFEREAAYAGRCEAWRHGRLPKGEWCEWDFEAAYAHVAADHDLPIRLQGHVGPRAGQKALEGAPGRSTLLRCRIDQAAPVAPTRGSHGILWPAGRIEGWWWDVEARAAQAGGANVEVIEGWQYEAAPALQQWARWCLRLLDAPATAVDPVLRLVVKGWSRTVVGRFGSRWSTWADAGEGHGEDVTLRVHHDGDTGEHRRMMVVGDRTIIEGEAKDAEDGNVAVMSFVMAQCRVNLWNVMTCAGLENVAYVDTDSVLVNPVGSARLCEADIPNLRVKSAWSGVHVYGPRQLVLRGKLRAAGIPRSAVKTSAKTWSAEVWRSLPASLRQGEVDRVVIRDRNFVLKGTDHRRRHLATGLTETITLD